MKSILAVLCLAALPASGMLGPSVEVSVAPPTIGRAPGTQELPHVATDGRDFFAVWGDSRGSGAIYGTRVLADGTVLDPLGILISDPGTPGGYPAVVWDGANYVVMWLGGARMRFVRVDRSGTVLGTSKVLLDDWISNVPSIASNGHGSMVIFSEYHGTGTVVRISQDGSFVRKSAPPQTEDEVMQIASNGDGYLLLWMDWKTSMIRLDDNGDLVPGSALEVTERDYRQLIAGIGGSYLLVGTKWASSSACARSIVGRLLTGSELSAPFVIHDAGGDDIKSITVTPDGDGFQVVWMKRLGNNECGPVIDGSPPSFHGPYPPFGLAQVHVGQDGVIGTPSTVAEGSGVDQQPSVARNAVAELVVWIDESSKLSAAVSRSGEPIKPIALAFSPRIHTYSALAAAENSFMAVWSEKNSVDETSAIYARRFRTGGDAIDADPIKVSDDQSNQFTDPAVSFDGAVWLFLWHGAGSRASARRMAADGTWIDAAPFQVGPPPSGYGDAVTSNGNGFALFTFAAGPTPTLTLIPRTGEARQLPIAASGLTGYTSQPSIAWDGSAYLAVWRDGFDDYIRGIRFDQDANVLTPLFTVHRGSTLDDWPSVACHADACAVAWESDKSMAAANIIGGTVVPFNTMIDASIPNTSETKPALLATPDGFQLFWTERGSGAPSLFTAAITPGGIGPTTLLGEGTSGLAVTAAITTHGVMGLTLIHPARDAAYAGVNRAFLRVWPSNEPSRRRAVGR